VGRGASMGALGSVHPNGDLELALTIRTFALEAGRAHLWVGGGIVWDSDAEAEIEESWVKARPLLAAVGGPVHA
jgi:anthranilate/para-aminobenzoate synthase component I